MYMTNFEFWGNPGQAEAMYAKYLAMLEPHDQKPTLCEWLYKKCDFALQLKLDDVVQYNMARADEKPNVRYARVTNINRCRASDEKFVTFPSVGIMYAGQTSQYQMNPDHKIHDRLENNLPPYHIKWPDIPEDFLRLMVGNLPTTCPEAIKEKCPFKDEYKEPVPPCMKEDAE